MTKKKLEEKLIEINNFLTYDYSKEKYLGLLHGLSGVALFQFYFSKYFNGSFESKGVEAIEACINKINQGYYEPSFGVGIAGFGWTLDLLEREGLVNLDADNFLNNFDNSIEKFMLYEAKRKNFDPLYGAIGYGRYFLSRYKNTKTAKRKDKYRQILIKLLIFLKSSAEREGKNKIKWASILDSGSHEKVYDFGLSHGIPGILSFLLKTHELDISKKETKILLKEGINYLVATKSNKHDVFSLYPNKILNKSGLHDQKSRLAWCYGDLGTGITLLNASKFYDNSYLPIAIEIFEHASKRRTNSETYLDEPTICHGSFGVAQIFHRAYKLTKNLCFKETAEFWVSDGLAKIENISFRSEYFFKEKDRVIGTKSSLLNGISGIGLAIIDNLSDYTLSWDECLMIA